MKKTPALLTLFTAFLTGCAKESEAIGVIGGADGPTAILVSDNFPILPTVLAVLGAVIIIAVIIAFITHKKD